MNHLDKRALHRRVSGGPRRVNKRLFDFTPTAIFTTPDPGSSTTSSSSSE